MTVHAYVDESKAGDYLLAATLVEPARAAAARAADLAGRCDRLVLESDESQDARDRRDLVDLTRAAGCRDSLRYEHLRAAQEPLLSVPDVVAWSWARGGEWRRRASVLVADVVEV